MSSMIEQVLSGTIDMDVFESAIRSDTALQNEVRAILPPEAVNNRSHPFWKYISYDTLHSFGFDYYKVLIQLSNSRNAFGYRLNLFGTLKAGYRFHYPDFVFTSKYHDEYNLYLDATNDCFDGPEVEALVSEIIRSALQIPGKGKRKIFAKNAIREAFHMKSSKRPQWIQGPEWPMGINTPMAFNGQEKNKNIPDAVCYYFVDVDTLEEKTIFQHY